jgi:hypothetical protein
MVRRLKLPLDDDDHMPPKGKPQPPAAQVKAIEDWIASGASFAAGEAPAPANGAPEATANDAPKPPPGPTPADPAAIKALQDRLVHVEPIAQDSPLLAVDFSAVAPTMSEDEVRTLLGPLRQQVADLSLARTKTGDSLVELVSLMPNLTRLNATGTGLTDAGLALLSTHAKLEDLVLSRTHLTDTSATALAAMPSLKRVYVWDAGLSTEALATLRAKGLTVDAGDAAPAEAVEAESELKLTNDAPALGQGGATGGAGDALKPVNTMCPVSGKPVDPNYVIVFKGRAIGFCCPNCPHDFWTDPAKFEDKIKP